MTIVKNLFIEVGVGVTVLKKLGNSAALLTLIESLSESIEGFEKQFGRADSLIVSDLLQEDK